MDIKGTATIIEKKQFRPIKSNGLMKLKTKLKILKTIFFFPGTLNQHNYL